MPRAKPFPDTDEEEKTTIESQWEDEASTTVEEGNVADKIRSLVEPRRPPNTSTGTGTGALDEPTVDDQHAQLSAITPVRDVARLLITHGNDAGNEIEIRPGKTYTIGRAIDNDVVLTDISVSRKHFDLRFEDGAWVIVDRGSGNGTVVNGNLEDNPFLLAHGDVIEIGNTSFRFDQPNAAPRPERTVDLDHDHDRDHDDDEEPSTVAGKPPRHEIVEPAPAPVRPQRPKTLPPPTPMRAATQPPPMFPVSPSMQHQAMSSAQMAATRPPMQLPGVPAMLGDPNAMAIQPVATLGPQSVQQHPNYAYPQATEIPPHSVHAQMLLIQTQNRRGDGSTMLVPPTPYDSLPMQPRYSQPQLTKRAKLVLSGVGLAVFAAVMTIAIVKSGNNSKSAAASPPAEKVKLDSRASNEAVDDKVAAKPAAAATRDDSDPEPTVTVDEPVKTVTEPVKIEPTVAKTEPTKTEPTKSEPTKTETAKTEPVKTAKSEPTKTKTEPVKTAKSEPTRTKAEPVRTTTKTQRKTEARREPPPTTVAAATKRSGGDPQAAMKEAERLYRAKKFNEASTSLSNASKKYDDDDARDLRRMSELYAKLGRAMAQGTAPATRATDAFEALRSAQTYDRNLGGAFDSELQTKLAQVAPKAALLYVANKNFPAARSAMLVAQQFGASESVKLVAQKLESAAGELYNEGMKELSSNPAAAKQKFRQVFSIVDAKSNWYQKAQKQLKGG